MAHAAIVNFFMGGALLYCEGSARTTPENSV
jgi:hypothetical protein